MAVSIETKNIRVRSLDIDFNEVSWELEATSEDLLDYTFQVQRSESPMGPFEDLSVPFQDRFIFIDNKLKTGHRWRTYFYRIRITHVPSGSVLDSTAISKAPEADLIAAEIRRHEQLLFQEHAGRRCWVLPIRTFGPRCSCYNPILRRQTRSGCEQCWDTTFVRGYFSPIESWIQIDPSPKTKQVMNVVQTQQSNTTMRMPWFPPLKPDDLVIEPENKRWRVVSVSQTEKGRAVLHQEVGLHEIPVTDVEYAIPLNLETALKDLWLSPQRNFSNPQSLETFLDENFDDIFALSAPVRR